MTEWTSWSAWLAALSLVLAVDAGRIDFNRILSGAHIRVTATHSPPLMVIGKDADGNATYQGLIKDICDWLFDEERNITYEFIQEHSKDEGFHVKDMRMVLEGKADMSTMGMSPDPERSRVLDFTGPILVAQYHFVNPYPRESSHLDAIVRSFQWQVWCLLLASLALMPFVFHAVLVSKRRLDTDGGGAPPPAPASLWADADRAVLHTVTTITEQGGVLGGEFLGLCFVNGGWLLMVAVLIAAYKSTLTSHLLVPKLEPMPSTFEELALRPDLQVVVEEGSKLMEMMMTADSGPMKTLGDTLRAGPRFAFRDRKAGNSLAASDLKVVYPGPDILGNYVVAHMKLLRGRCHMTMAKKPTGLMRSYHIALTKNGRYSQAITAKAQFIWETGLIHHWYKSYMPRGENCRTDRRPQPRNVPLKLEHLAGAFLLWGLLASASVLVYLLEHLLAARRRRRVLLEQ